MLLAVTAMHTGDREQLTGALYKATALLIVSEGKFHHASAASTIVPLWVRQPLLQCFGNRQPPLTPPHMHTHLHTHTHTQHPHTRTPHTHTLTHTPTHPQVLSDPCSIPWVRFQYEGSVQLLCQWLSAVGNGYSPKDLILNTQWVMYCSVFILLTGYTKYPLDCTKYLII